MQKIYIKYKKTKEASFLTGGKKKYKTQGFGPTIFRPRPALKKYLARVRARAGPKNDAGSQFLENREV